MCLLHTVTVNYVSTVYARASQVTPGGTVRWVFGTNNDGNFCANRLLGTCTTYSRSDTKELASLEELHSLVTWFSNNGWSTRVLKTPVTY